MYIYETVKWTEEKGAAPSSTEFFTISATIKVLQPLRRRHQRGERTAFHPFRRSSEETRSRQISLQVSPFDFMQESSCSRGHNMRVKQLWLSPSHSLKSLQIPWYRIIYLPFFPVSPKNAHGNLPVWDPPEKPFRHLKTSSIKSN